MGRGSSRRCRARGLAIMARRHRRFGTRVSFGAVSKGLAAATLALGVVVAFGIRDEQRATVHARAAAEAAEIAPAPHHPQAVPIPLAGVIVFAATRSWTKTMHRPLRTGEPVPV